MPTYRKNIYVVVLGNAPELVTLEAEIGESRIKILTDWKVQELPREWLDLESVGYGSISNRVGIPLAVFTTREQARRFLIRRMVDRQVELQCELELLNQVLRKLDNPSGI